MRRALLHRYPSQQLISLPMIAVPEFLDPEHSVLEAHPFSVTLCPPANTVDFLAAIFRSLALLNTCAVIITHTGETLHSIGRIRTML
uniref:Uncharacterized protein n=1 Tax=Anguilla anguilla TaxID=7936 RepID=A0A0E9W5S9_ANGAN